MTTSLDYGKRRSSRGRWSAFAIVVLLVTLVGGAPGIAPRALADGETITVAAYPLTPFVVKNGDEWNGFTIELWEEIAKRLGWKTQFIQVRDVADQLQAVADGRAQVGATALSITADREEHYDFSQPILDAGLQIMVKRHRDAVSTPGLGSLLDLLWSKTMLIWLSAALAVTLIPAHIMWLTERRHTDSMVSKAYFPGIFQAFGWGFGALVAMPPDEPRHWQSKMLSLLFAYVGVIFVALYTANLTAALTVEEIESQINGPDDLYNKRVCTVAYSTAAHFLADIGVAAKQSSSIDDCYRSLEQDKSDAVVFDAPILRYYVSHEGANVAAMAGPKFHDEDYGLMFRAGSELRRPIDKALLAIREDGTYQTLELKWFGSAEHSSAGDR